MTAAENSSTRLQTPGAGSSKARPPPLPISRREHLEPQSPSLRTRTPTRSSTFYQEVELGVYLNSEHPQATPKSLQFSSSPSRLRFSSSNVLASSTPIVEDILTGPKSVFLANSEWSTDIVTFCSHARLDSGLGQARITHIQARKSHRPPFLHEYILVFFTAANEQRFVVRIDRLGKVKLTSAGGIIAWLTGRQGTDNTAIQQVEMYHIQDDQCGIDSPEGPWLERDGRWDSEPIATLVSNINEKKPTTRNTDTEPRVPSGPTPRLKDVARLLEAILLEMPSYHLVTTNCYFMTRSSLLLLQRCFPTSFTCHIGSTSDELVPASQLAEPIWAGLFRWYLPFAIAIISIYFPLLILGHVFLGSMVDCEGELECLAQTTGQRIVVYRALRLSLHGLDVPLLLGVLHTWMTALEVRMNDIVVRLSTQYHALGRSLPDSTLLIQPEPFGVAFSRPWWTFAVWLGIGFALSLIILFVSLGNSLVIFIFFMISVVASGVYNCAYSDTSGLISLDFEDIEAWQTQAALPEVTLSEPESARPQTDPSVATASAPVE